MIQGLKKLVAKLQKRDGYMETPDPTPVAARVNFKRPPTLQENLDLMLRRHRSREIMERLGVEQETLDEMGDFDVDDSDDFTNQTRWTQNVGMGFAPHDEPPVLKGGQEPTDAPPGKERQEKSSKIDKNLKQEKTSKKSKNFSAAPQQDPDDGNEEGDAQ